jgi:carboxyl-terminal processing protease
MQRLVRQPLACLLVPALLVAGAQDPATDFGAVFDEHWERLADDYPYFELYDVDWEAERADHRPRAVAAENAGEFAWEIARMLSVLKDAHVEYMPPVEVMTGWSMPDVRVAVMERKPYVIDWGEGHEAVGPAPFRDDPRAYPEIVTVQGMPNGTGIEILAAGPVGSTLELRLRWPDGSETDEEITRPAASNLPPPKRHYGEEWIVHGRVGSIGYLRVKTFSPKRATLGPSGKMTPILRERLEELLDTDGLILDLQGNGGGVVGASDPFLSHFLERRRSYKWGNSGGKKRVLVPRSPRYRGAVVALVDGKSASGGEWAARILRDAGRATVVGGRTKGAEAAVHSLTAADGSTLQFSAWPMVEPGVTPFQYEGIALDHALPVKIEDARAHGYDEALERTRRLRFAKALELLGAPADDLGAIMALADEHDSSE